MTEKGYLKYTVGKNGLNKFECIYISQVVFSILSRLMVHFIHFEFTFLSSFIIVLVLTLIYVCVPSLL